MMTSCHQTGVPIHFHSSTTSGSASLMSLRILLRVSPRQSPSSAILFEMSSDADFSWLAPASFMLSSSEVQNIFHLQDTGDQPCFFWSKCNVRLTLPFSASKGVALGHP